MKIAVIIPTRNDRPKFEANCMRMVNGQTLKPDIVDLVNDNPLEFNADGYLIPGKDECDITWRYKTGYDRLRNKGIDCILFMENDDWYSPKYIETMVVEWEKKGRPDIFGTNYTIYYHMRLRAYFYMNHTTRSSAMSTLIKPDLNIKWCPDNEPYTDLHLWGKCGLKKITFKPERTICIGMKHGVGLCGGRSHTDRLHRYSHPQTSIQDKELKFLKANLDSESFDFYTKYFD